MNKTKQQILAERQSARLQSIDQRGIKGMIRYIKYHKIINNLKIK